MKKFGIIILFSTFAILSFSQTPLFVLFQKTDALCFSGSASLNIFSGTAPYKITWSTGDTNSSINGLVPGTYTVYIKDGAAKDTTISFSVENLTCEVGIANHFTPNDDGFNDSWVITNTGTYPNFELVVFNRWGQTVHQQSQKYFAWDGKSHGLTLPDATYYYIFYFDKSSKDKFLKGDVSILR